MLTRRRLLRTLPLVAGNLAACKKPAAPARYQLPKKPLSVLTSTVQAADLIHHIGRESVIVRSLIPPGANPHLWQPTAADLAAIQLADVFFLSGLGLEARFTTDLDDLRGRGLFVGVLANGLAEADILQQPNGKPDPHFWMNPRLWAKAAATAAEVLGEAAVPSALWFLDRSHEYITELDRLHLSSQRLFNQVPARTRFVMSSHDTLRYFGKAYGVETRSLATAAGEAATLVPEELTAWLGDHSVTALFRESLADAATIKKLARPLSLNSDSQIFSLSLAAAGARLPGITSDMEVDTFLPALRYTVETIHSRLATS